MPLLTLSVGADWRRSPPRRDWLVDPAFSLENFDFGNQYYPQDKHPIHQDNHQDRLRLARFGCAMFLWLCGLRGLPRTVGAQGWPLGEAPRPLTTWIDEPYGCPPALLRAFEQAAQQPATAAADTTTSADTTSSAGSSGAGSGRGWSGWPSDNVYWGEDLFEAAEDEAGPAWRQEREALRAEVASLHAKLDALLARL
jgi:hypothetical protein